MEKHDHHKVTKLLEIRKLISILSSWGNVLVNSTNGEMVSAQERLKDCVNNFISDYNVSYEELENLLSDGSLLQSE